MSMLLDRQAIVESKGDKLSSSAECRIRTQGPWNRISSRLNARSQTDWAMENKAKILNLIARPYDQRAVNSLDPTTGWLSRLTQASDIRIERRQVVCLAIIHTYMHACMYTYIYTCMFVVANFDALAQASDTRIERRQLVFLCWMQDSNLGSLRHQIANRLNARSQTDWVIEDQAKNLNLTARPYGERAFSPLDFTAGWLSHLALAKYMFVVVNFNCFIDKMINDFFLIKQICISLRLLTCWFSTSMPAISSTAIISVFRLWATCTERSLPSITANSTVSTVIWK